MAKRSKVAPAALDQKGTGPRVACGYVRVSTEKQADKGHSLDAQRAQLIDWARLHGYELAHIYADEGISGKSLDNRPGVRDAIDMACRTKGVLVAYSLSRLARSTRDAIHIAERLNDSGANLASISEQIDTTTPTGRCFFTIMAAMAQLEREQTGERTSLVMARLREQGRTHGGRTPYGYRVENKMLVPIPEEQAVVAMIREWSKTEGPRAVAERLNERGIPPKTAAKWSSKVVWSIARKG